MRRLIFFVSAICCCGQAIRSTLITTKVLPPPSGISVLTSTIAKGVLGGTSTPIDTTSATLIVVSMGWNDFGGTAVITDSKSNTWSCLAKQQDPSFGTGDASKLCYVYAPTTDAAHTFTVGSSVGRPGAIVLVVKGTSGAFDVQNGSASGSTNSIQPGSITPSSNNEIVITGTGNDSTTAPLVDSGFTLIFIQGDGGTATQTTVGLGYKIQTTAAAVNPTWSWTTPVAAATTIAAFK